MTTGDGVTGAGDRPSLMASYEGYEALRFERHGDVLEVTIDRPGSELNAIDGTLHAELARLFRELKREREARAVLLTGSKQAFSAGGDFAWFPTLDSVDALDHLRLDARQLIWDLVDLELPDGGRRSTVRPSGSGRRSRCCAT